jgi:uncharacterized metal-binding protein
MIDAYFRVPLLFLRFGGIPIKLQAVSTVNSIYNEILTVCYYITFVSITMDFVLKNEDMQESMKNVRMIAGMAVVAWIHLYLR